MKTHPLRFIYIAGLSFAAAAMVTGGCRNRATQPVKQSDVQQIPPGSFAIQWPAPLGLKNDAINALYLRQDMLFAYSQDDVVYALTRNGGAIQFSNNVAVGGGTLRPPVLLADYLVYPISSSLEIYTRRGRQMGSVPMGNAVSSPGIANGDIIYIGVTAGAYGRFVAMDVTHPTNVPRWSVLFRGAITAAPAMFKKLIYVGDEAGNLVALSHENGAGSWPLLGPNSAFQTRGSFVSDIYADENGVYAANTDSKLYVLNPENGKILWQYYAGEPLKRAPAVTRTMVYQYVPGTGVAALDKTAGEFNRQPKWTVKDAIQFASEDDTHAYLVRRDHSLVAVDKSTGKVQFTSQKRKYDVYATNTTDAMIFASTKGGNIVAIKPVLAAGEAGVLVMDWRESAVADGNW